MTIKAEIAAVPAAPGVYVMLGIDDRDVMYVGMAKNLRHRLHEHFVRMNSSTVADKTLDVLEVSKVRYFTCESKARAGELEAALIRAHAPRFNLGARDLALKAEGKAGGPQALPRPTGEITIARKPGGGRELLERVKQKARHIEGLVQVIEYAGMTPKKQRSLEAHVRDLVDLAGQVARLQPADEDGQED